MQGCAVSDIKKRLSIRGMGIEVKMIALPSAPEQHGRKTSID